jgi:hypothetical protein
MKMHTSVEPELVDACLDRIAKIVSLTGPSSGPTEVEYSALIGAAAMIMAIERGMPCEGANLSKLGRRIFLLVATELDDHIPQPRPRKGARRNGV